MKKLFAALTALCLLCVGCTPQKAATESPLPADTQAVEGALAALNLPYTAAEGEAPRPGQALHTLTDTEGREVCFVISEANEAGQRMVQLIPLYQEGEPLFAPADSAALFALGCTLYGGGLDGAALCERFAETLSAVVYQNLPADRVVWLVEEQGGVYAQLKVEALRTEGFPTVIALNLCNRQLYEDAVAPAMAQYNDQLRELGAPDAP